MNAPQRQRGELASCSYTEATIRIFYEEEGMDVIVIVSKKGAIVYKSADNFGS